MKLNSKLWDEDLGLGTWSSEDSDFRRHAKLGLRIAAVPKMETPKPHM